eukprot:gene26543-biopygen16813
MNSCHELESKLPIPPDMDVDMDVRPHLGTKPHIPD